MSHQHFTIEKRYSLQTYLDDGVDIPQIATKLDIHHTNIRREINRNAMTVKELETCRIPGRKGNLARPKNSKHYSAEFAHYKARIRRYNANQCHRKLYDGTALANCIIKYIKKRWSPEQISGRFRTVGVSLNGIRQKIRIAVQTIYDFIYGYHPNLRKYLRHTRGYKHNRQYYINKKNRERLQAKKGIDTRPKHINNRSRIGHWEGDTVLGHGNGSTGRIGTLTERKCGYLTAFKIDALTKEQKFLDEAEQEVQRITMSLKFADGCIHALTSNIKLKYLKTLTLDNGSENSGYEWIERGIVGLNVFFAHAYHSWERGTNENTNGLLRQYFPKGLDFRKITQEDIDKAVNEINNRPRKRLNWRTPKEVMQRNHGLCNWK